MTKGLSKEWGIGSGFFKEKQISKCTDLTGTITTELVKLGDNKGYAVWHFLSPRNIQVFDSLRVASDYFKGVMRIGTNA